MTTHSELLESLNWRYATKKFDSNKTIPSDTWKTLEQTLILAPSSFGLQPWKFINVENKATRTQLKEHSWNQPQITDASHLIVFAAKITIGEEDAEKLIDRICSVRQIERAAIEGYRNQMLGWLKSLPASFDFLSWTGKQTYVALGFFLSACASLKIDACPMEGIDRGQYDTILNLKRSGYSTMMVATAGYRASDDKYGNFKKVRYEESELIVKV